MTAQAGDTFFLPVSEQKARLREALRKVRRWLPCATRRHAARLTAQRLLRLRRVRRAQSIAVYLPMINELDTAPLIDGLLAAGKQLFAPRIRHDRTMVFVPLGSRRRLRRDALGIRTPLTTRPQRSVRRLDLLILPLVGFDSTGSRLGMGAGYYDRVLNFKRIGTRPWLIGYAYPQQEVENLPSEPWDVKLDGVALSSGLRRQKRGS